MQQNTTQKRFASPNETCQILGVGQHYIRNEIRLGHVPGFQVGKKYLVDVEQYSRILSERAKSALATSK